MKILAHDACGVTTFGEPGLHEQAARKENAQVLNLAPPHSVVNGMTIDRQLPSGRVLARH